ncbi:MAG: hypothetical protein DSY80_09520 [Desulfocapsa sp.]|nr:MAG: hypothetical protein DSY80_09520 [Desulfocapsa sp.]
MIMSIVAKKEQLEISEGYPKKLHVSGCGVNEVRTYFNNAEFMVIKGETSFTKVKEDLALFGKAMIDSDIERIVIASNATLTKKSEQKKFGDNSDVAVLARMIMNHESNVNKHCSSVDFRNIAFEMGTNEGFSRETINSCISQ